MRLVVRPIDLWPGELTPQSRREPSRFSASWSATVNLLEQEAEHLGVGGEIVLQLAVVERDCRLDGWIRANASPSHPGVIISFDSRHGPLRYSTDRFGWGGGTHLPAWQANVRAIALGLEALRKVDRYGIAKGGEQYVGYRALAAGANTHPMNRDEALWMLARHSGMTRPEVAENLGKAYRSAAHELHPDRGGDPEDFRRLGEARALLEST